MYIVYHPNLDTLGVKRGPSNNYAGTLGKSQDGQVWSF